MLATWPSSISPHSVPLIVSTDTVTLQITKFILRTMKPHNFGMHGPGEHGCLVFPLHHIPDETLHKPDQPQVELYDTACLESSVVYSFQ